VNSTRLKWGRLMRAGGAGSGVLAGVAALLFASAAAKAEERLVLEPYPGAAPWRDVVNDVNGPRFIREQMPAGQTTQSFTDSLTAQSFPGQQSAAPTTMIGIIFNQFSQSCDMVATVGPKATQEGGREVAYGQLYCGRQKGETYGAHIFFKVIQGSDALYVVDRDFRTPPSDHPGAPSFAKGQEKEALALLQAEAEASRYLTQKVYLCDPVFPDPKCSSEAVPTGR
jgi:hypothetical protein